MSFFLSFSYLPRDAKISQLHCAPVLFSQSTRELCYIPKPYLRRWRSARYSQLKIILQISEHSFIILCLCLCLYLLYLQKMVSKQGIRRIGVPSTIPLCSFPSPCKYSNPRRSSRKIMAMYSSRIAPAFIYI